METYFFNSKYHCLYHYTNFYSGIKILASKQLKFGRFENMNDISEVQREFLSVVSEEKFQKEVTKYQSISFSTDSMQYQYKGFQINTMWGYYADKGRGMCLVFNQEEVLKQFKKIKSSYKKHSKVQYNGLGAFYPDCD